MKYIAMLLCIMLLAACGQQNQEEQPVVKTQEPIEHEITLSDAQLQTMSLDHTVLEKRLISGTLQLNGKVDVDPDYRVSLSSVMGGHIRSVRALPGKSVSKGQVILTLEDNAFIQIQQDYLTTLAQLLSAEPNYSRQKELNRNKSTSDKSMQQAETEYRSLLAVKNGLEEKLRLIHIDPAQLETGRIQRSIHIVAPFSGMVSKVSVNKGKYVAASDELVELINPNGLLLELKVFEKDLQKIKVGQEVDVFTNVDPDQKASAKIITKGSSIQEDGSTEVIAKLTDANTLHIMNGLYVNALIKLGHVETYTLPADAVLYYSGKSYVYEQLDRNNFRLHEVDTGDTVDGNTAIADPAPLIGKKIINKGAYGLLMALKNKTED